MKDFQYLFRFADQHGDVFYANLSTLKPVEDIIASEVQILEGDPFRSLKTTDGVRIVERVSENTC